MKLLHITLLSAALVFGSVLLAQTQEDLPSAPSATRPQNVPAPLPKQANSASAQQSPQPAQTPASSQEARPASMLPPPDSDTAGRKSQTSSAAAAILAPEPSREGATAASTPKPTPAAANVEDDEPLTTITKRVDEVNVIFTVTDKHGKFIKNLTEKDFTVRDDNKPPRQVDSFSSETNLPLRVGLLIDASNSIRERFRFEQESAAEFLAQVIRPQSDLAFVIGFDTSAEVTADFTDNVEALSRGLHMLRPGGGTAMYDAVYFACRDKLMKAKQTGPVRRAIILISDGEDNQSRVTRDEAIEMAQRAEVTIYAISTNVSGVKLRGDKVLERMADLTGGRAFFPFKVQDVATALTQIQDELRSQYAIAYKPADFLPDGRYRTIQIAVANHKNLKVRARHGYFAPKQ